MDGKQRCPKQNAGDYQFAMQLKTEAGLQDVRGLLPWVCAPVCQPLTQPGGVFQFSWRPMTPGTGFLVPDMHRRSHTLVT